MRKNRKILDKKINVGDCIVRQMTNEERARYGLPLLEKIDDSVRIIPAPQQIIHKEIISEETRMLSKKIKQEMFESGISQTKIAKLIGISPSALSNVNNLKYNPKKENAEKIKKYLKEKGRI